MTIERSTWIDAPRERVWQAITDPAQLIQWFVPNLPGAEMSRDENGKLAIHMGPMAADFAIHNLVEAQRRASIRSLPDKLMEATFALEDERGGTQVTVNVAGFELLPAETREDRRVFSSEGWDKALKNLTAFVDGKELPHPQAYVGPLFGYWRETQQKLAIERSVLIKVPRERAWRAITDPKQIQQWFSPGTAWQLSALEVGGRFYVQDEETNTEKYVEIIEVLEPLQQLVTRAIPEPPDTIVKRKTYTLKDEDGGTRLTLTLVGYEPEPDATRWPHMENDAFGFGMMFANLNAFLEEQALPFPGGF
jgi:uncharacterized protein YndB with AHSA1/START domain